MKQNIDLVSMLCILGVESERKITTHVCPQSVIKFIHFHFCQVAVSSRMTSNISDILNPKTFAIMSLLQGFHPGPGVCQPLVDSSHPDVKQWATVWLHAVSHQLSSAAYHCCLPDGHLLASCQWAGWSDLIGSPHLSPVVISRANFNSNY